MKEVNIKIKVFLLIDTEMEGEKVLIFPIFLSWEDTCIVATKQ